LGDSGRGMSVGSMVEGDVLTGVHG
jgi:hypothetical protein